MISALGLQLNAHHFQEFLFRLLIDNGVGVAHHSDQHVEQENWDQDLKEDKHGFGHTRVRSVAEFVILKKVDNLTLLKETS